MVLLFASRLTIHSVVSNAFSVHKFHYILAECAQTVLRPGETPAKTHCKLTLIFSGKIPNLATVNCLSLPQLHHSAVATTSSYTRPVATTGTAEKIIPCAQKNNSFLNKSAKRDIKNGLQNCLYCDSYQILLLLIFQLFFSYDPSVV